ncbi:MAG: DUF1800 domain-containing protein [Oscillospiraceae bacterium]|jgi:hypothetical protein
MIVPERINIPEWNIESARHLLSRTLYGYTKDELEFALSLSIEDYIDNYLLDEKPQPAPPGVWVDFTMNQNTGERTSELAYWWFVQMLCQGHSFREKMVMFWHNHFVSAISTVNWPQRMYHQNKLFREYAFGNFKELTQKVTIDPAMLIYLDGYKNTAADPNENYARELLELFTVGIGNFNETDVAEAARSLTGWKVENITAYFEEANHDNTPKTFMGRTGNFDYPDIINIIFERPETAVFLCRELYTEFVFFEPDEAAISGMAEILRANNYNLKPVLSYILKEKLFSNPQIIGSKIKSPVEFLITFMRQMKIETPDYEYMRRTADEMSQTVFDPPNVKGWDGDKTWISTKTLPIRNIFTDNIINGRQYFEVDMIHFARSFGSSENALQFVNDVVSIFYQYPISEDKKTFLLKTMLDGAVVEDWSTYDNQAESRLKAFFKALLRTAEYQLA